MLDNYNNPLYPPVTIIRTLLNFVLRYNCFNFGELFFLQVRGVAMGTKLAPNFANLFMANLEEKHVFSYHLQPLQYSRYIDDIFLIWPHGPETLHSFEEHLNSVHETIKFIFESSTISVNYLNITVSLEAGRCTIKPFFKATNTIAYMMGHSYHPYAVFKGLII